MSTTTDDFAALRPLLFSIAYRMLGSVADAEDVVQDAFLRWQRVLHEGEPHEVESPKAYLSAVVTRLCIDHLRSARVARERYIGPWLPDPVPTAGPGALVGAEEQVELADSVSMAFLVLLESLTPVERAVFLLREVFGYDYGEIARMVDRSETNCRQIATRARKHVEARRPRFDAPARARDELTARFLDACRTGDLDGLVGLLADDVTLWSDGGGKVRAARRPIRGRNAVARFVLGLARRWDDRLRVTPLELNGQPAFVVDDGDVRIGAVVLDAAAGAVHGIRIVVNPDKLAGIAPQRAP